ncbi:unnamed protein product [Dracunculus medinensis]|uniref:Autophagy-related protein 13 n=1 Tax=Dracunculus medinensis TaxID=318479 RepID=A0A0N4U8D6_DRAME|nr:unnamed protein product [Dracunculus medinensis]
MSEGDAAELKTEYFKFCKAFTSRMIQILVQSRMGEPINQSCLAKPDSSDWFNIRIDEYGEIAAYLRANILKYPPLIPAFTLDFLLYTAEKNILPLESCNVDPLTKNARTINNTQLYHQLGTLLKSIVIAARITPLFRYYVRKQCSETFVILYRVSFEPDLDLGQDRTELCIGCYPSPYGQLSVDLLFRTRMEIIPYVLLILPAFLICNNNNILKLIVWLL